MRENTTRPTRDRSFVDPSDGSDWQAISNRLTALVRIVRMFQLPLRRLAYLTDKLDADSLRYRTPVLAFELLHHTVPAPGVCFGKVERGRQAREHRRVQLPHHPNTASHSDALIERLSHLL